MVHGEGHSSLMPVVPLVLQPRLEGLQVEIDYENINLPWWLSSWLFGCQIGLV
jgi:hypothetical protein